MIVDVYVVWERFLLLFEPQELRLGTDNESYDTWALKSESDDGKKVLWIKNDDSSIIHFYSFQKHGTYCLGCCWM